MVDEAQPHHLIAEQGLCAFHDSIEHLWQRGPLRNGDLDLGELLEHCLALLEQAHEPDVLLLTQLALGAQRAFLLEHSQGAESHRQAAPHGAQQPGLLCLEALAPGARQDQVTADLFDGDADGPELANPGKTKKVGRLPSGRQQRGNRHLIPGEPDHLHHRVGGDHGSHLRLQHLGGPLHGTEHRRRRVRTGGNRNEEFGQLLRGPAARRRRDLGPAHAISRKRAPPASDCGIR